MTMPVGTPGATKAQDREARSMTNTTSDTPLAPRPSGVVNTAPLLGQVMILVSVTLGLTAVGARIGRDLSPSDGVAVSCAVLGMLIIQAVGGRQFRVGTFAVGWLWATGLALGIGIGPTLAHDAARGTSPRGCVRSPS